MQQTEKIIENKNKEQKRYCLNNLYEYNDDIEEGTQEDIIKLFDKANLNKFIFNTINPNKINETYTDINKICYFVKIKASFIIQTVSKDYITPVEEYVLLITSYHNFCKQIDKTFIKNFLSFELYIFNKEMFACGINKVKLYELLKFEIVDTFEYSLNKITDINTDYETLNHCMISNNNCELLIKYLQTDKETKIITHHNITDEKSTYYINKCLYNRIFEHETDIPNDIKNSIKDKYILTYDGIEDMLTLNTLDELFINDTDDFIDCDYLINSPLVGLRGVLLPCSNINKDYIATLYKKMKLFDTRYENVNKFIMLHFDIYNDDINYKIPFYDINGKLKIKKINITCPDILLSNDWYDNN